MAKGYLSRSARAVHRSRSLLRPGSLNRSLIITCHAPSRLSRGARQDGIAAALSSRCRHWERSQQPLPAISEPIRLHRRRGRSGLRRARRTLTSRQCDATDHEAIQISSTGATVSVGSRSSREPLSCSHSGIHTRPGRERNSSLAPLRALTWMCGRALPSLSSPGAYLPAFPHRSRSPFQASRRAAKSGKESRPGLSNAHTGFTLAHSRWSTGAAMGWATWCASTVRPPNITLVPIDRGDPQAVLFAVAR